MARATTKSSASCQYISHAFQIAAKSLIARKSTRLSGAPSSARSSLVKVASTRSLRGSATVENSSALGSDTMIEDTDMEGPDDDPLPVKSSARRQIFKEVVVPARAGRSTRKTASYTPTASSVSEDLSGNEWPYGYETPGTSTAATPAETSLVKAKPSILSRSTPQDQRAKRKRPLEDVDDLLQGDEMLAKKLQQEEYMAESLVPTENQRRRIIDSDEESDLSLSSLDSDSSFLSELLYAKSPSSPKRRPVKAAKSTRKRSPKRPMRNTTRRRASKLLASDSEDDGSLSLSSALDWDSDLDSLTAESTDDGDMSSAQERDALVNDPLGTVRRMRKRRRLYGSRVNPIHVVCFLSTDLLRRQSMSGPSWKNLTRR